MGVEGLYSMCMCIILLSCLSQLSHNYHNNLRYCIKNRMRRRTMGSDLEERSIWHVQYVECVSSHDCTSEWRHHSFDALLHNSAPHLHFIYTDWCNSLTLTEHWNPFCSCHNALYFKIEISHCWQTLWLNQPFTSSSYITTAFSCHV